MKNLNFGILKVIFVLTDLAILNICLLLSYYITLNQTKMDNAILIYYVCISSVSWLIGSFIFSLYNEYTLIKHKRVSRATWRNTILHIILITIWTLLFNKTDHPYLFLWSFLSLFLISISSSRFIYSKFETILLRNIDSGKATSILAIASIGGHWVQLLRLMPLFENGNVTFISTKASLQNNVAGYKYYAVPDANRKNKFNLVKCCLSIFSIIFISKPQIIITTGAAPGLFGIFIGRLLGVKTIWIDSIANVEKLSLSGKIALKVADKVYTQWHHLSTPTIAFAGNILGS